MRCAADGTGKLLKGRNSPLHQFLTNPNNAHGVVVVNYSNFKHDDLSNFNAFLDENRSADGTPVPKDVLIIGLLNPSSKNLPPGDDFFSRFLKRLFALE